MHCQASTVKALPKEVKQYVVPEIGAKEDCMSHVVFSLKGLEKFNMNKMVAQNRKVGPYSMIQLNIQKPS